MSDIPSFPYEFLWRERQLRSVANLTREDGALFLELAPQVPVRARTTSIRSTERTRRSTTCAPARLTGSAVLTVAA